MEWEQLFGSWSRKVKKIYSLFIGGVLLIGSVPSIRGTSLVGDTVLIRAALLVGDTLSIRGTSLGRDTSLIIGFSLVGGTMLIKGTHWKDVPR